jgi:CRP/FNR family transcriptional regulator, cyclic AMP receptor protein
MRLDFGTVLGLLAAALYFTSYVMKSMVPLRALALASNVFFVAYGYVHHSLPELVLHSVLLPLNARRLWEIRRLTREIERATRDSPVSQWLLPHMRRRTFTAGEVLFRRGDPADEVLYIATGEVRLQEADERLGPGELIGEIGLFSPESARTQTVICETHGELYSMTAEMMYRLYYQNPRLGFYFMRLIIERLLKDVRRTTAASAPVDPATSAPTR